MHYDSLYNFLLAWYYTIHMIYRHYDNLRYILRLCGIIDSAVQESGARSTSAPRPRCHLYFPPVYCSFLPATLPDITRHLTTLEIARCTLLKNQPFPLALHGPLSYILKLPHHSGRVTTHTSTLSVNNTAVQDLVRVNVPGPTFRDRGCALGLLGTGAWLVCMGAQLERGALGEDS